MLCLFFIECFPYLTLSCTSWRLYFSDKIEKNILILCLVFAFCIEVYLNYSLFWFWDLFSEQTYLMFKRFPIPVFYNWHKIVSTINTNQRLFCKDETLFQNNTKMNIYSKHSITKKALLIKHSIQALFLGTLVLHNLW